LPPVDTQPLPAPPEPPAVEPAAPAPPEPFFAAPPTIATPEPTWGLTAAFNAMTSGAGQATGAEPEPPPAVDVPVAEPEPEPEPAPAPVPAPVAAAAAPVAEPAAVVPAGPLSDADVERIARRVLELATPLLEQIAWEVLPDVAETLVRQRIAELEAAAEAEN